MTNYVTCIFVISTQVSKEYFYKRSVNKKYSLSNIIILTLFLKSKNQKITKNHYHKKIFCTTQSSPFVTSSSSTSFTLSFTTPVHFTSSLFIFINISLFSFKFFSCFTTASLISSSVLFHPKLPPRINKLRPESQMGLTREDIILNQE